MLSKLMTAAAIAATTITAVAPTAALARDHDRYGRYENYRGYDRDRDAYRDRYRNYYGRQGYYDRAGWNRGDYYRGYRGNAYRSRCRDSGTGGLIIGAIAGGLLGNSVAGYGDRTTGTIIGGGLGALAGRAIDKGDSRC